MLFNHILRSVNGYMNISAKDMDTLVFQYECLAWHQSCGLPHGFTSPRLLTPIRCQIEIQKKNDAS